VFLIAIACSDRSEQADTASALEAPTWHADSRIASLLRVEWEQPVPGLAHVEYEVDGEWRSSPERQVDAGPVEQIVLGVPFDTEVRVRVRTESAVSDVVTARTGPLPAGLPLPELLLADDALVESTDRFLLGSVNSADGGWNSGEYWMWILDHQGRVVWALPGEDEHFTIWLQTSLDDDILWDVSTYWSNFDQGAESRIHRMKLDGVVSETIDAPGMHHAFLELPDRSILWGGALDGAEKLLVQSPEGEVETLWDCAPFYERMDLNGWCHTNSIWLDEERDRFVLSFPTRRTFVLEIDAQTGEELRWFGYIPESWDFESPETAFVYQHGVSFTDEGTLLVSSQVDRESYEGVVREYLVDEDTQTLRQVWSHGEGDGITARFAGEAHRLPGGNTLHNTGTTPRVREITPEGEVAWDLAFEGDKLIGRTIWLEDLYRYAP